MKALINTSKILVVKKLSTLILALIIISLFLNYNDFKKGFIEGYNIAYKSK